MGKGEMRAEESIVKRGGVKCGESVERLESKDQQLVFDISRKPVPAKECRD